MARLLTPLVLLALFTARPAAANNTTSNNTTGAEPAAAAAAQAAPLETCHLKSLQAAAEDRQRYSRCLKVNTAALVPLFGKDENITATFNQITGIINHDMDLKNLGTALPTTTMGTLSRTSLEITSLVRNQLIFKVLFPKLEGTPKVGNGTRQSVERSSHATNITMEGTLKLVEGAVMFSNITVVMLDSMVSEFVVSQDSQQETLSIGKTTLHEEMQIPLKPGVLDVANIVFQMIQAGEKYLSET